MKMVFEEDIERCDYLECILSQAEANKLVLDGIVVDFPYGLRGKRNLNVFIRIDKTLEDYAASQRKSCEIKGRVFGECSQRDGSRKAAKTGGRDRL